MTLETIPFDVSRHLTDPADQIELVARAFATGDGPAIRHALKIVARARGMAAVARNAGVTPEALDRALGNESDPQLSTILGILGALGLTPERPKRKRVEPRLTPKG